MSQHSSNPDDPGKPVDVLVVGGGVNGAGIALDAAGRGLSVTLCEQHDLASGTSSASSKLVHGGLRYLETHQYALVKKALRERELLLKKAPHIMWPLRFRLPHNRYMRPGWMIRAGLFLYDFLAPRQVSPRSSRLRNPPDSPLQPQYKVCYEYSDGWVDDARLVVLNAIGAKQLGAQIHVRTSCSAIRANDDNTWTATLTPADGPAFEVRCRAVVNAAGPWAGHINQALGLPSKPVTLRLVKGSHIVVPKLHPGQEAYILQHSDKRIVFAIPYEQHFTLIGTTDEEYQGRPQDVKISPHEIDYLLEVVNQYFTRQLTTADVVHTYSGVRPLFADEHGDDTPAQAVPRDYTLDCQLTAGKAIALNVFGGKITTYRKLAEQAVDKLCQYLQPLGGPWTATTLLPGADIKSQPWFDDYLQERFVWLPSCTRQRYVRQYGSLCLQFLDGSQHRSQLGRWFGQTLPQAEVDYLLEYELAQTSADILWRRTKLGLLFSAAEVAALDDYLATRQASAP